MGNWALPTVQEAILRLVVATLLSGLIGLERQHHERPAGFRTNLLVGVGSCLFMMISAAVAGQEHDPGRVAANVVVGIGFLGAGTIIRHGSTVRGLTTAAGLWVVSAIGLAAGMGWFEGASITTLLALLVLGLFRLVERRMGVRRRRLVLTTTRGAGAAALSSCLHGLEELGVTADNIHVERDAHDDHQTITLALSLPPAVSPEAVAETVGAVNGIESVEWD